MHALLLAFVAQSTFTVSVTVSPPPDPLEVTQVTATCRWISSKVELCTIQDDFWVTVLQCEGSQCQTIWMESQW